MKALLIVASLALTATGCQFARFTPVPSTPNGVSSARHNDTQGEPGSVSAVGWAPSRDGRGYSTWTWDPSINGGCNEHEVEPAAELDNAGALCKSVVP